MTFMNLECIPKENIQGENKSKEYLFRRLPEWTEIIPRSSIEQVSINNTHYIDAQLRLRFEEMAISTAEAS